MKTKKEPYVLKDEAAAMNRQLQDLTAEELMQVTGSRGFVNFEIYNVIKKIKKSGKNQDIN